MGPPSLIGAPLGQGEFDARKTAHIESRVHLHRQIGQPFGLSIVRDEKWILMSCPVEDRMAKESDVNHDELTGPPGGQSWQRFAV